MPSHFPTHRRFLTYILTHKKRLALWMIGGMCALFFSGSVALLLFAAWVSKDLPRPNELSARNSPQSTKIYDRTGEVLLYEVHGGERRTLVPIDKIPLVMQHATVAIEDRRFYEHHGVDWLGLVRAVVRNGLRGQGPKGTSTLTQQLVRNTIIVNERSYLRKLKEMILSLQIERTYTKEQVLQMYLNEVPYGSTLYGIEAATLAYFNKSSQELTLDEATLLASIPQAPDRLSPYGTGLRGDNRPQLVARQHLVIDKMREQNFITEEQARDAKATDTLKKLQPQRLGSIKAPHFVMYVRGLLSERFAEEGGLRYVEQSGLKVITSLDWKLQEKAEKMVSEWVEKNGAKYQFNNAALVSLDPTNGEILTMVGSADYFNNEIEGKVNVTLAPRQPGSSFKPIVYAAAFAKGYLPQTEVYDTLTNFPTDGRSYEPRNYNLREYGVVSLRKALQGSLNIPAVKVLYLVGIGQALDFAENLGYTTFKERSRFGLALVLGGGEVTPLEHTHAFSAFANDGIQAPTTPLLRVEDAKGASLFTADRSTRRVLDPQVPRLLSDVLTDNVARTYIFGSSNRLTLPDRPVAVKTGTTSDYHDAWTIGYTPNLVTTVWVGNTRRVPMKAGADSSTVAAPLWQNFMKEATKDRPKTAFQKPEPPTTDRAALLGRVLLKKLRIDKATDLLAHEFTPPEQVEERSYLEPHDLLSYLEKDDPLGEPPTNPASDPHFSAWEAGVRSWLERTHASTTAQAPTLTSAIFDPANAPVINVLEPVNQSVLTSSFLPINLNVSAPRGVTSVHVALGEHDLGTVKNGPPWVFGFPLSTDIPNGFYDLTFTARDDVGNSTKHTITIQIDRSIEPMLFPEPEISI